ncbi:MAG: guanosine-3',5'-bis(diphosphate) 3'-diphosphatase, partial [Gammaproteobacteria bacterium]|nr:guanosine-3',5'-bis(diphosphate) 3'-diphosphatase [Gammaproteobacteria bacterium]
GRRLLNLALEEFSLTLKKIPQAEIDSAVKELNLRDADDLFEKIGLGERLAPLVARRLQPAGGSESGGAAHGPLMIAGTEGLLVTYARCCFPIPNDPIMAYLSMGRGLVIHRQNCGNLSEYRKQPDKWLPVAWEADRVRLFSSEIQLEVSNRVGVLAAVASNIADTETNIDHVTLEERDADTSALTFELQVRDRKHLARVIRTIRRMPDVQRVHRTLA